MKYIVILIVGYLLIIVGIIFFTLGFVGWSKQSMIDDRFEGLKPKIGEIYGELSISGFSNEQLKGMRHVLVWIGYQDTINFKTRISVKLFAISFGLFILGLATLFWRKLKVIQYESRLHSK